MWETIYYKKISRTTRSKRIPLILTYSRFLPNLTAVVRKNWNILQTNKNLRELFQEHPMTAFKRNKNLKQTIGSTRMENGKVEKFNIPYTTGECTPFLSGARTLCSNKCWKQTHSWANRQKEHLKFFLTLTLKVNTLFIYWNAYYARCNMLEKQRLYLT